MEPLRVHTVVISVQHSPDISLEDIRRNLMERVVKAVIPAKYLDDQTIYHLLPSGKFLLGGPQVWNHHPTKDGDFFLTQALNLTVTFLPLKGRCGADGEENHRGHIWWMGRAWRRGFLWERLLQSGPFGSLRSPLGRQVSGQGRTVQEGTSSGENVRELPLVVICMYLNPEKSNAGPYSLVLITHLGCKAMT